MQIESRSNTPSSPRYLQLHNWATARLNLHCNKLLALLLLLSLALFGCRKEEDEPAPEVEKEITLTISAIKNIPAGITFDRVTANITGACWRVIGTVEAPNVAGTVTLPLPTGFALEQLQKVDRRGNDKCGFWPAASSNAEALVASLGDIIAYWGETKVGRIYLSNRFSNSAPTGKAFIFYQYADRPFLLSGQYATYQYANLQFKSGWNAYAKINPAANSDSSIVRCTTEFDKITDLSWCFESWVP